MVTPVSVRPGLREQHKRQTSEALRTAGVRRFAEQGFDATTIEQIADDAGVSLRTFFRYYPCKEALLFGPEFGTAELARFAERPADEPLLESMRVVLVEAARSIGPVSRRRRLREALLRTHPSVRAYANELLAAMEPSMVALAAERLGVDPADDLRPIVFARLASTIAAYVMEHGASVDDLGVIAPAWLDALDALVGEQHRPALH